MNSSIQTLKEIDQNDFNAMLNATNKAEHAFENCRKKIKISFLRNFTVEPIEPFLKFHSFIAGIKPEYIIGNYDSIKQEILSDAPILVEHQPEIIVLSLHYPLNDLFSDPPLLDRDTFKDTVQNIYDLLKQKSSALILVNTLIPPFHSQPGVKESNIAGLSYNYIFINQFIREYVLNHSSQFFLMDWERYVRILGEENSMDYRYWYMHRAPFKKSFLNLYAKDIVRIARTLKYGSKKCLVLDCDNTLWGGIVAEDGIDKIKLDNYEFPGKIFFDFQQAVLSLQKQGVILTLCSKNNEKEVLEVFENHPHSVLQKNHFAATRINWEDKASNIISLSKELNLGLDSFVFVDDSPVECDFVKNTIPEITVIQVPSDLFRYPQILFKEGLFDMLSVNEEDISRTIKYHEENRRKLFSENFEKLDDYLRSLELELLVKPVKDLDIPRIAQLTQKTNQFNLSVKRYTETDIKKLIHSDNHMIFSLTVKDKFGDYGLTGIFIAEKTASTGIIDTFLLSCRVLSRKIEYAAMSYCLNFLNKLWGINFWHTDYFETEKNEQVKKFLIEFGFTITSEQNRYQISVEDKLKSVEYIKIFGDGWA